MHYIFISTCPLLIASENRWIMQRSCWSHCSFIQRGDHPSIDRSSFSGVNRWRELCLWWCWFLRQLFDFFGQLKIIDQLALRTGCDFESENIYCKYFTFKGRILWFRFNSQGSFDLSSLPPTTHKHSHCRTIRDLWLYILMNQKNTLITLH